MDATGPWRSRRASRTRSILHCVQRFIVVRDRADEFIEKSSRQWRPCRPVTDGPRDGPRSGRESWSTRRVVRPGRRLGHQRCGRSNGRRPFGPAGLLLSGDGVDRRAGRLTRGSEELFGPVAVVEVVDDLDAAIAFANATPWGLGGAIHATDQKEIDAAIAGLTSYGLRELRRRLHAELPFGGTKESGFGRELGEFGVREFTNVKSF